MLSNLAFGSSVRSSQARSPGPPASPSTPHAAIFSSVEDELRDARRVYSQGQEEDLRYALERVIKRVAELSSLLKMAYKAQSELENQLGVEKSNLQLLMYNNEMLEEALRRDTPCSAREVGWRRWSAREEQNMQKATEDRPRSLDYGSLNEPGRPSVPSGGSTLSVNGSPQMPASPAVQPETPMTSQESRFFKFRLGSGLKSPPIASHASHLTSPSLPSLISDTREKELQDLREKYDSELQAHKTVAAEKAALEAELESLSQALFEEANKMVATERIKRAETEEELRELRKEKDALREALRLVEGENGRLRSANLSSGALSDHTEQPSSSTPLETPAGPSVTLTLSPPSPEQHALGISDGGSDMVSRIDSTSHVPDVPDHLKGFALEPAPNRRTQSTDKAKGLASTSLDDSLSTLTVSDPPITLCIPDVEPSPWVDVQSSTALS
ncbi:hypothetical protein ID866_1550 [Astraeus odoratus]|nr:hypothetical protein ID866_1550 [Astraeus odoratus]